MKIIILFIARREMGELKSVGYFGGFDTMSLETAENITQTTGNWIKNGNIYKCDAPLGGEYVLQWEELSNFDNLLTEFKQKLKTIL